MGRTKMSSLFRSTLRASKKATTSSSSSSSASSSSSITSSPEVIKQLSSVLNTASSMEVPAPLSPESLLSMQFKQGKPLVTTKKSSMKHTGDLTISDLKMDGGRDSDDLRSCSKKIKDVLHNEQDQKSANSLCDVEWITSSINTSNNKASKYRKELNAIRKHKQIHKKSQVGRYQKIIAECSKQLGTETTLNIFESLGKRASRKDFNAMIGTCLQKARDSDDIEVAREEIYRAFQLFELMKEKGFELGEDTYDQILKCLVDMSMVEEFYLFSNDIKDQTPKYISSLGYYEMLLSARTDNVEKVRDLCNHAVSDEKEDKADLIGNYLLALSESGREEEILLLLEAIDVERISSLKLRKNFFNCLGKLQLESFAEKFLSTLKNGDIGSEVACLILDYAVSLPNLLVKDVICKYRSLHEKLEVKPSSGSYGELICYCCTSQKVYIALDLLDEMCENDLDVLPEVLHSILCSVEESNEFNVIHRIYSIICCHKLKPNTETFKVMISLATKIKDFVLAYDMLKDMEMRNLPPTSSMYNSIMGGYFREGDTYNARMVLKHMEAAKVKPDSHTYCVLISNSKSEEDIVKCYEEMNEKGIHMTKHMYMALINAYAGCGQIEKAKQVISNNDIHSKDSNDIKSALVQALAINHRMSDALDLYDEIKQSGGSVEPKSLISVIEKYHPDGDLNRLLQLLEDLESSVYWNDGCCRVIMHCFLHKNLSVSVDLIKRFKDNVQNDESAMRSLLDEVFILVPEEDPSLLQTGLELFQIIKNDLRVLPSRRVLDYLLTGCARAKDRDNALVIWKEHEANELPYNVLSYVRMYQALLACGDSVSAKSILKKIPQDDFHNRLFVKESKKVFTKLRKLEQTKNKN